MGLAGGSCNRNAPALDTPAEFLPPAGVETDPMIEVANLSKRYGLAAIRDVSFTAADGQILGFLGPNGARKTTTTRIIIGFMPPTSARVDGSTSSSSPPRCRVPARESAPLQRQPRAHP